jgi:hypothetical protein
MMSWEELLRSVTFKKKPRFHPADDDLLDAFESYAGLALPQSYREFVKIFGACEVGRKGIIIAAPQRKRIFDLRYDLTSLAKETHTFIEPSGQLLSPTEAVNPERSHRMVFFADNFHGGRYGWDPEDIGDTAAHEYAVYCRYSESEPYPRVASSFRDFVLGYCLGDDLKRWQEAGCPVGKKFDFDPDNDPRLFQGSAQGQRQLTY